MLLKRALLWPILFCFLLLFGCGSKKMTPSEKRAAQASKTIKKSQGKESRAKEKAIKKAKKRHWKNQSKQFKQTIRRNERRLKKEKSKKGREPNDFIDS
jgi:Sec-independent protein translocase protein TatA